METDLGKEWVDEEKNKSILYTSTVVFDCICGRELRMVKAFDAARCDCKSLTVKVLESRSDTIRLMTFVGHDLNSRPSIPIIHYPSIRIAT